MFFCKQKLNLGFQNFRTIFLRVLFLVATLFCTYGYLFELILALLLLLTFGDKGVRVLAEPFLTKFHFFPNGNTF